MMIKRACDDDVFGSFYKKGEKKMSSLQEQFLFSGVTSVPNLLLKHYRQLQLSAEECLMISWLLQKNSQEYFMLNIEEICSTFGLDDKALFTIIQHLMDRQVLIIKQREDIEGKKNDWYSLRPLWQQLDLAIQQEELKRTTSDVPQINMISAVEKGFGRPLNAYEIEHISNWIHKDHYSEELILLALKESVIRNALSIAYIDKILLTWDKKGIKTIQQVEAEKNKMKMPIAEANSDKKPNATVPLVQWMKR